MKDAKNVLKTILMIMLGLFVFILVAPVVLQLVGITFGILIGLAKLVIYIAVVLAIGYLILVGIRALLR